VRHDEPVHADQPGPADLLTPLLVLGAVVALVSTGFAHGFWWENLHNGLLALAFGGVAAWTLLLRPRQREALLFAAVGILEGVLFFGRQVAHGGPGGSDTWWGWFGVWPLALILAALTWAVLCFPEGHFLSRTWHSVGVGIAVIAVALSLVSAFWPVEYGAAGIHTPAPFELGAADVARSVWDAVAHPAYALFQLTWLAGVLARWRRANGVLRQQLAWLGGAVGVATAVLLLGLAVWHSPRLGLLVTPIVPVVAGWSMVSLNLSLGRVVEETRASGGLANLSPRENEILDLLAQGLSNKAISDQLHLSIKTVEPVISSIFTKLQLPADESTNRRVLAVLAVLEGASGTGSRADS
jgi:DNA-binding CsgD family transcriptional regulator